ncbi:MULTISPECIES: hypothetical protein [Streptomyces]|uniref:hypothetical protein n=1 Tax=Streptomyces TaxID=1883 RepID=UPI000CD4D63D|nr:MULTISPECIES: hypothetical protein [Streptomyces]
MQPNDARILRGAAILTAVAGAIALVAGAVLRGSEGAVSVGLGVLVGGLFFASGQFALAKVVHRRPDLLMGAAVAVYISKVLVLLALLVILRDASFMDGRLFALGVLVTSVAWIVGQVHGNLKVKTPYVVTGEQTPAAGPGTDDKATG